MPAVEWYHRKAEECVALAKAASLNDERARPLRDGGVLHPVRIEPENGGRLDTRRARLGLWP
jgi:hypothetical protein